MEPRYLVFTQSRSGSLEGMTPSGPHSEHWGMGPCELHGLVPSVPSDPVPWSQFTPPSCLLPAFPAPCSPPPSGPGSHLPGYHPGLLTPRQMGLALPTNSCKYVHSVTVA